MTSRRAWVFGAGITGLTAAHELAERGFDVIVVERAKSVRHALEPDLGGMARTQWVVAAGQPSVVAADKSPRKPSKSTGQRAYPLIPAIRVSFTKNSTQADPEQRALITDYIALIKKKYHGFIPPLQVFGHYDNEQDEKPTRATDRAEAVCSILNAELSTNGLSPVAVPGASGEHPSHSAADIRIGPMIMPAEHGFRYFPAFYRHVFDTMKRIRLIDDHLKETARSFGTVFDNLVSTKTTVLALRPPVESVIIPREPPRSLREVQKVIEGLFHNLDYTPEDIALLSLKIAIYMTSGSGRRSSYEKITWWDFIEGDRLSPRCALHMDVAPAVLGGMVAREGDARTQGNCLVQLLLNQLTGSRYSDATLNGPTSSVWFAPWRDYLKAIQNVRFEVGKLVGFKVREGRMMPKLAFASGVAEVPAPGDVYVLALPLTALLDAPDRSGICRKFLDTLSQAIESNKLSEEYRDPGDFQQLHDWINHPTDGILDWNLPDRNTLGPLRNFSGIQFFFATEQQPTKGHTLYLDSSWRLSSIAQASFWSRPRVWNDHYRGIVSVDIGEWYTGGGADGKGKTAWNSAPAEIATEVWRQIVATLPSDSRVPSPSFYHLDDGIEDSRKGRKNRTPYLIAMPRDWPLRPGNPVKSQYGVACGSWVIAGTFMRTFTRLTTMESANESARHAVNALLLAIGANDPLCEVWDPEQEELRDLEGLKSLDDDLYDAGLPHTLDIVGASTLLDSLRQTVAR